MLTHHDSLRRLPKPRAKTACQTGVYLLLLPLCAAVASVRVSSCGAPLVVLTNQHAYCYSLGMRCWMRLADDSFPSSAFHSSILTQLTGLVGGACVGVCGCGCVCVWGGD